MFYTHRLGLIRFLVAFAIIGTATWYSIHLIGARQVRANAGNYPVQSASPANGTIQLSQTPEYPTGASPRGIASGDFDGDGNSDLVATHSSSYGGVSVLRGLGEGRFALRLDVAVTASGVAQNVYVHDLDVDGRPDIILTANSAAKMFVLRNVSPGPGSVAFEPPLTYPVGGNQAHTIAFGDFDGDGPLDLAIGNSDAPPPNSSTVTILRNVSAGSGGIALTSVAEIPTAHLDAITPADFDGDGKIDIALAGGLRVLRNQGTGPGSFSFAQTSEFDTDGTTRALIAGDLNGDGKPDLARLESFEAKVTVLVNTSTGPGNINFSPPVGFGAGSSPWSLVTVDLNGDGKLDLACTNQDGNNVSVLLNTTANPAALAFGPRPFDLGTGLSPYRINTGDVNNDGKPDLITANVNGNSVSVLINEGVVGGQHDFAGRKDYVATVTAGATSVAAADFDSDGLVDLVGGFEDAGNATRLALYRNNGSGKSHTRLNILPAMPSGYTVIEPTFVATGDLDGDGRIDIAMHGRWGDSSSGAILGTRVLQNTSTGPGDFSFAMTGTIMGSTLPRRIHIVDLDSDGKLDLFTTDGQFAQFDSAKIYRNTSSGAGSFSFETAGVFNLAGKPDLIISDVNNDGKTDVLYGTYITGLGTLVRILLNSSSGPGQIAFTTIDFAPAPAESGIAVVAGDLDGDGKKELITSSGDGKLFVSRNTSSSGPPTFELAASFTNMFISPRHVADFDLDGKLDVIGLNHNGYGYVQILRNQSSGIGQFAFQFGPRAGVIGNSLQTGHKISLVSDLDHNGLPDFAISFSSPAAGGISVLANQKIATTPRARFDFDGDGRADVSLFRPSNGRWYIVRSSSGFSNTLFGVATDKLSPADFDGDGSADISVFRNGAWYWINSGSGSFQSAQFGQSGDMPVPADFTGDGRAELAVFRGGNWYVLDLAANVYQSLGFGIASDKPVAEDFDGDGRCDFAVFRDGAWYVLGSTAGFSGVNFGIASDTPVVADYDGDGKADPAVYRGGTWYVLGSAQGFTATSFGLAGDVPVPADYDGDGKSDRSVYRNGDWYQLRSTQGFVAMQFGLMGDRPAPAAYLP